MALKAPYMKIEFLCVDAGKSGSFVFQLLLALMYSPTFVSAAILPPKGLWTAAL